MLDIGKERWKVRVWEDGTFSFGYVPFNLAECEPVEDLPLYTKEGEEMIAASISTHGLAKMVEFVEGNPEAFNASVLVSPLGSSTVDKSHSDLRSRGQVGISSHGKKLVRNAALRLQQEKMRSTLSFVTLTIPGVSAEGALEVCRNWSQIVRVFEQKLKRRLVRAGLPGEIVGCTEVQENRFAATNVVALHLHLLFQGREFGEGWVMTPKEIRAMWKDTLEPHLSHLNEELYWDACENVQRVKKDAAAYLGKYLSKGVKACKAIKEAYPEIVLPTCWYICTNSLRVRVKQHTLSFTSKQLPLFEDLCAFGDTENDFLFIHPVKVNIGGDKDITVGYVGKLKPELKNTLYSTLHRSSTSIPF